MVDGAWIPFVRIRHQAEEQPAVGIRREQQPAVVALHHDVVRHSGNNHSSQAHGALSAAPPKSCVPEVLVIPICSYKKLLSFFGLYMSPGQVVMQLLRSALDGFAEGDVIGDGDVGAAARIFEV